MRPTEIAAHTRFRIGAVDPRVFGGFLEHLGRAVYQGVYDPDSAHADADGCRADVLAALRRLKLTALRYPGGNFVSGSTGRTAWARAPRARRCVNWRGRASNRIRSAPTSSCG